MSIEAYLIGGPCDGQKHGITEVGTRFITTIPRDFPNPDMLDTPDREMIEYTLLRQVGEVAIYYDASRFSLPEQVIAHLAYHYCPF